MKTHIYRLTAIAAILALWFMAAHLGWLGKSLLASPGEVVTQLIEGFRADASRSDQVQIHALHTLGRALEGWIASLIIGIPLGLFLGGVRSLFLGSEPIVEFVRAIPPVLIFPLFLVAFNYDTGAYTWTVSLGCLPVILLTVARGVREISITKIEILKIHGVSRAMQGLVKGLEVLPAVFLASRLTFSIALVISVVTEMVFTPRTGWALGALARDSEIEFNTPRFYACVVVIGLFGYGLNFAMRRIEQRLWRQ